MGNRRNRSASYCRAISILVLFSILVLISVTLFTLFFTPGVLGSSAAADIFLCSRESNSEYCGKRGLTLKAFIQDTLEKKYSSIKENEQETRREYFKQFKRTLEHISYNPSKKPAARLTGAALPDRNETTDLNPVDIWYHGDDLMTNGGLMREGVRYNKGRLVVPATGTYTVYSCVEFVEPYKRINTTENGLRHKSIKHALYKYSVVDGKNTEIALNEQPLAVPKNRVENIYGSYVSTVVKLFAGDEVSVQVTHIHLLTYTKDNYFGLMLI